MAKIENKWENTTEWERKKAYEELSELIQKKQQKDQPKSIEERIKDIRKQWPIGIRIT